MRATRLFEAGLVWKGNGIENGLREDCFSRFHVGGTNPETNSSNQIGYLPVETNEILVFEKAEDASGLNGGTSDDCFEEIAIAAQSCQIPVPG
ncbi:MAG TPA: hypothetical protein VNU92_01480 [Edaphobacter sp.]|nr:hypothetical protein [Edaphobacter sp.]